MNAEEEKAPVEEEGGEEAKAERAGGADSVDSLRRSLTTTATVLNTVTRVAPFSGES